MTSARYTGVSPMMNCQ